MIMFPEPAMPTLRQCLEALPQRDVRGIATRLGLRQHGAHRKALWIDAIVAAWLAPDLAARFVAALSPAALGAALQPLFQLGPAPLACDAPLSDPDRAGDAPAAPLQPGRSPEPASDLLHAVAQVL
jgi:hypothetical protein